MSGLCEHSTPQYLISPRLHQLSHLHRPLNKAFMTKKLMWLKGKEPGRTQNGVSFQKELHMVQCIKGEGSGSMYVGERERVEQGARPCKRKWGRSYLQENVRDTYPAPVFPAKNQTGRSPALLK